MHTRSPVCTHTPPQELQPHKYTTPYLSTISPWQPPDVKIWKHPRTLGTGWHFPVLFHTFPLPTVNGMWTITGEGDCLHSGVSGPGTTLMWSSALGFSNEIWLEGSNGYACDFLEISCTGWISHTALIRFTKAAKTVKISMAYKFEKANSSVWRYWKEITSEPDWALVFKLMMIKTIFHLDWINVSSSI